jgi:hypothetical protein
MPTVEGYRASVFGITAEGDDPLKVGMLVLGLVGGVLILTSPAGWAVVLKGVAAGALAVYAVPKLIAHVCPNCWETHVPGPACDNAPHKPRGGARPRG